MYIHMCIHLYSESEIMKDASNNFKICSVILANILVILLGFIMTLKFTATMNTWSYIGIPSQVDSLMQFYQFSVSVNCTHYLINGEVCTLILDQNKKNVCSCKHSIRFTWRYHMEKWLSSFLFCAKCALQFIHQIP